MLQSPTYVRARRRILLHRGDRLQSIPQLRDQTVTDGGILECNIRNSCSTPHHALRV